MKKFLLSAITIIAAGTFVSCKQNGDGNDNTKPNRRVEVNFTSNITKIDTPQTKAVDTEWDENDEIGIFMFEESANNIVERKSNIKYYTVSGGENGLFVPDDEVIYFPDNGDKVRFMSYYPHTAAIDEFVYKVDVSDQSKQYEIDLLHSFDTDTKYDKNSPGKKVSLMFDHKLTKININIKPGDGLTDDDIENTVVTFNGFNTKADFNLISGALSDQSAKAIITPLKISAANNYKLSFESIVLPVVNSNDATIVFDLNNGDTGEGIENDLFTWKFGTEELEGGYEYLFNVTIKRSGIVVEAEIKPWVEGDITDIDAE